MAAVLVWPSSRRSPKTRSSRPSTFVLVLLLAFMNVVTQSGTEGVSGVLAYLSPLRHLEDFQKECWIWPTGCTS